MAIRTLLGSDLHGYGFSVSDARFGDLLVPISYGGEFRLRHDMMFSAEKS